MNANDRNNDRDTGISRFSFFASIGLWYSPDEFLRYLAVNEVFWSPVWIFGWLAQTWLVSLNGFALQILSYTFWLASFAAALGIYTRVAIAACFVSGLFVLSLSNSYSCFFHSDSVVFITIAILSLSKVSGTFSLDSIKVPIEKRKETQVERWPTTLIRITLVFIYFSAGISKLVNSGFAYFNAGKSNPAYLAIEINDFWRAAQLGDWWSSLRQFLLENPYIVSTLGQITLSLELCAPIALLVPSTARWIIPALFLMQVGIIFSMQLPNFTPVLFVFFFWIPWTYLWRVLKSKGVLLDNKIASEM